MIHLTRIDPARNMARFYTVALQLALFGEWARIGSAGRLVSCRFASEREAALAMAEHLEAKLRKGYDARLNLTLFFFLSELALFSAQTLRCPLTVQVSPRRSLQQALSAQSKSQPFGLECMDGYQKAPSSRTWGKSGRSSSSFCHRGKSLLSAS
jgi:predicted DNA-binding WGR domain protein